MNQAPGHTVPLGICRIAPGHGNALVANKIGCLRFDFIGGIAWMSSVDERSVIAALPLGKAIPIESLTRHRECVVPTNELLEGLGQLGEGLSEPQSQLPGKAEFPH
jgi:hypothetical protein